LISESELYLIDFGNAIRKSEMRKDFFGTRWFAPPEQYEQSILDERSDIYAFGMVLYYMVFGQEYTRRKGENIEENNRCSKDLAAVINRCLMLKKTIRYSSIMEIKKRLLQIQQKQNETGKGKTSASYSVCGSQRHIGCTHFAIKLCKFLKYQYGNCLYVENNPTSAVCEMLTENGRLNSDGVYEYEGIPMLPFYEGRILSDEMLSKYKHIVYDYGILREENREEFLKGKHCFTVVGAKDWEITNTKQKLNLLKNSKAIYLANFITTKEQAKLLRCMNLQIERLPYESFTLTGNASETMKLLKDIL
jgi:serine/threonine protein kinase